MYWVSAIMLHIPTFYIMQIVSGIKYYFTVKIGRTVCRKGASDLENCAFHNAPNKLAQVRGRKKEDNVLRTKQN